MAEKEDVLKTFKEKVDAIKDNSRIKDKDKAILSLIGSDIQGMKDDDVIKYFVDEVDDKNIDKFIGKPLSTLKLVDEKYSQQVEPMYFWVLGFMREQLGIKNVEKLVDTYSASEASGFHEKVGRGLASTQDRVVNHMRSTSQMLQTLFRITQEITKLTERLGLYYEGEKVGKEKEGQQNFAEMTLKDRYISFIEGGAKNPGSVYGLAQQVGFTHLDHHFMHNHIFDTKDLNKEISAMKGVNLKYKEVLGRKLRAYVGWRTTSKKHLEHRRKWMLSFLKQHYNSIHLNIEWMKPYLKTARRMMMNNKMKDSPDLLVAIEQAMMEIELFGIVGEDDKYNQVVNPILRFRTHPESEYSQKYQGPVTKFSGRIELEIRSWTMSKQQVLAYKAKIKKEDFSLIAFDDTITESLDALGKDVRIYLEQADKEISSKKAVTEAISELRKKDDAGVKKKEKSKPPSAFDPFIQVFHGFAELASAFGTLPEFKRDKDKKPTHKAKEEEKDAKDGAIKAGNTLYTIFKKSHGMLSF